MAGNTPSNKDKSASNKSNSRRKLIKVIGVGGAAHAGAQIVPNTWQVPKIASVILPAHAQTTQLTLSGQFIIQRTGADNSNPVMRASTDQSFTYHKKLSADKENIKSFGENLLSIFIQDSEAMRGTTPDPTTTTAAPTTATPTTAAPTTATPTTVAPTTVAPTTATPTTTTPPTAAGVNCPISACGELTVSADASFSLVINGIAGTGVVEGATASINGVSYAVTGVDSLVSPTTATVTASGGDCGTVTLLSVFSPGSCP